MWPSIVMLEDNFVVSLLVLWQFLLQCSAQTHRVTSSEQNFAYFNRKLKDFLCRFVTMDEIWIHHYTPESLEGSKLWIKPGESAPKPPKTDQSAGKVIWRRKNSFFVMTMHHLTQRTLHRQKSMNWVSNRFRIHRLHQTWPPATIICSKTSKDGCVVGVSSRTKKLNGKEKGIFGRFDKSYSLEGI